MYAPAARVVAAAAAAIFAALAGGAGCAGRGEAKRAEAGVRAFVAAARAGDRAAVYQRLGPATRARLDALVTATRRTSGRLVMKPDDFLSVGWAPPSWEMAGMRTLRRTGDRADVEVYGAAGDRHTVLVVREGGEWKVELIAP